MSTTQLVKYVFAKSIDRGGPGIAPDWPQADPALNRFYLVADVEPLIKGLCHAIVYDQCTDEQIKHEAKRLLATLKGQP